jgi:glycosyltransferase involved in cell wall biosynthesis
MSAKVPNSAFVTVGESAKNMAAVEAGTAPGAEYAVLRRGHFSEVLAMVDRGSNPGSTAETASFAASAYWATRDRDNVYLGEEFPGIQYLAVHALLRRAKRIAMLIHNTASLRRRLPLVTLGLGRSMHHALCLSRRSKLELETTYGIPPARITVIGSRVDTAFFSPDPAVETKVQVCSAGAVNRDYKTLIDAVSPLGIPLKIAADTAWRYSTGEQKSEPVPDFVEMRSWGSYMNLRRLYAESRIVVVPLEKPILSGVTVALEAMAMGKPVILTHNGYVEDFMVDGESGLFVPSGDGRALEKKIRHLLDHPSEAERMGARAREWVLDRFTVDKYVDKIIGVWN